MIARFRLPDLGEGLVEAELVRWLVGEGDAVTLNQPIAEVETAKAVVELPSPHEGTVRELHAAPGDAVAVGAPLVSFEAGGPESAAGRDDDADPERERAARGAAPPNLVGYGAATRSAARPKRRARVAAAPRASGDDTALREAAPHDMVHHVAEPSVERPRSTPPVRRRAQDLGIDLALVEPTGEGGVVTRADVDAYADRMAAASGGVTGPVDARRAVDDVHDRTTRVPIRGVRRATAEAMVRSAFTAPHVTVFLTIDVTATTELIASLRVDRRLEGHRVGLLAVAAKAVCLALAAHPSLNSRYDVEAGEIVEHHYVDLGIAAATSRGLIVPHVEDADRMTLVELSDALRELARVARAGRTDPEDLRGGTFTITNVGVFGVDAGTPILNPGEAGILALGAARRRPWEHRGEIALRDVMTLALSFDHRLVDGEQGARFLADVGAVLHEPGRALLLG